jgi:WD40 repeat protein
MTRKDLRIGTKEASMRCISGAQHNIFSLSLDDKNIKSWNPANGAVNETVRLEGEIPRSRNAPCEPVFSGDSSYLGIPKNNSVTLYDPRSGRIKVNLPPFAAPVDAMAFSPDNSLLAIAEEKKTKVSLWDTRTGKKENTLESNKGKMFCLAFSPDGKLLAAGGKKSVTIWDMEG